MFDQPGEDQEPGGPAPHPARARPGAEARAVDGPGGAGRERGDHRRRHRGVGVGLGDGPLQEGAARQRRVAQDERHLDHLVARQLDPRAAPHAHERAGQPEAGRPRPHHLARRSRCWRRSRRPPRRARACGCGPTMSPAYPWWRSGARRARVARRCGRRARPGRRPRCRPGHGGPAASWPAPRRRPRPATSDHDDRAEPDEPALGVVLAAARSTPGRKATSRSANGGEERHAQPPDRGRRPSGRAAASRPSRPPCVGSASHVRPSEQPAGLDGPVELREHLAHDVVPGGVSIGDRGSTNAL